LTIPGESCSNWPTMVPRTFLLSSVLAIAVLADSWISVETFHPPTAGTVPVGPGGTPEVADQRAQSLRIDRDSEDVPSARALASVPPASSVELSDQGNDAVPSEPRPVSPSGWLGRRHWRSPT